MLHRKMRLLASLDCSVGLEGRTESNKRKGHSVRVWERDCQRDGKQELTPIIAEH